MASYIISYDLNGPTPSHKDVDQLIRTISAKAGRAVEQSASARRGRRIVDLFSRI